MDDLKVVLQEFESVHHATHNASQHIFGYTGTAKFVKAAGVHVLHAVIDARFDEEGAVKLDDGTVYRPMKDIEFHNDRIKLRLV